ncbi:5'-nucleotidase C-terminal domain-containing protein [Micrococcales bacterium 31B]|nr:5'-nucleotidase C-terminal domain-containing protein [Micrococcales bacterium 31B]
MRRRTLLASAFVGGAALFTASCSREDGPGRIGRTPRPTAGTEGTGSGEATFTLTVLGTTDLHSYVLNWDYFKDAEFSDDDGNHIGLAKAATLIKAMRAERGAATTLTIDAGDTIQGSPVGFYYARIEPIVGTGTVHPLAATMNAVGYDAVALGNHEFNYGVDHLNAFIEQVEFPVLCANALEWQTTTSAYPEYVIKEVETPEGVLKVGIVGLVTPGCAIWDKANVENKLSFNGIVEQAKITIPKVKAEGADVVIVSCHSGSNQGSSYGDALPFPENASTELAEQVDGIDAILVGHAHAEIPEQKIANLTTGKEVLLSEPYFWGRRVSVMNLGLAKQDGAWGVVSSSASLLNANTAEPDADVVAAFNDAHGKVRGYINSAIGTSTAAMPLAAARYSDTAAIDLINYVQAHSVQKALAATDVAGWPVLSIAAAFIREGGLPAGELTVRNAASLYTFDNTLNAVKFTGANVKEYLEFSAAYFKQVDATEVAADDLTNADGPDGRPIPDYNYDIMGGLDAPLTYDIDVAKPVGQRIANLAYDGQPLADDANFVLAVNNYRAGGGGNFPGLDGEVVFNEQKEIRQFIIEWVAEQKTIDPALFHTVDWRIVSNGRVVSVTA